MRLRLGVFVGAWLVESLVDAGWKEASAFVTGPGRSASAERCWGLEALEF
jgi:hypothetical protein